MSIALCYAFLTLPSVHSFLAPSYIANLLSARIETTDRRRQLVQAVEIVPSAKSGYLSAAMEPSTTVSTLNRL